MSSRRAVIFDMDGVLVLSAKAHWVAWQAAAAARGTALDYPTFLGFNGMTNQDICARLWGARATPEFVQALAAEKEGAFRRAIAAAVPLAPGCRELLAALHGRGHGLAVGSSAPRENVDLVLDGGGIRPFFGAVVHADLVARGKPAPDIFLCAAERLGIAPAHCVVVEDAPAGVQAARAAGMRVVGVATNHTAAELLAEGAEHVAASLQHVEPRQLW